MTRGERLDVIMKTLRIDGVSTVLELSRQLNVSHMTVRRDLLSLEKEQKVRVLYGSVMLERNIADSVKQSEYSLIDAGATHAGEKKRIGQLAASLVQPQDSLIIDSGSTTEYLAKFLPDNISYTVLCYSLNIIAEIARRKNCRAVFSGGDYHENTMMFEGPEGLTTIRNFRATIAFLSAAGVDKDYGVTCMNTYERETKKKAIQYSQRSILLVDSPTFGVVRSDYFANLSDFDEVITDGGVPPEYVEYMKSIGIIVRIA